MYTSSFLCKRTFTTGESPAHTQDHQLTYSPAMLVKHKQNQAYIVEHKLTYIFGERNLCNESLIMIHDS